MSNRSSKPAIKQNKVSQRQERPTAQTMLYSGPIPPASEMAKYEALSPGMADRILGMAERQVDHRIKIETAAVLSTCRVNIIGVISAAIIALASLTFAGFCVYMGHEFIGAAFGTGGIGGIAGTFIYGTRSNRQEREAKWEKALQTKAAFQ